MSTFVLCVSQDYSHLVTTIIVATHLVCAEVPLDCHSTVLEDVLDSRESPCPVDNLDIKDALAADFWPVESEGAVFDGPGVDAFG